MGDIKKEDINKIIEKLEGLKKKSYTSRELRGRNQMMSRLDRIQDKALRERISLTQEKLKDKTLLDSFSFNEDAQGEDDDLLRMFGIKKKKKVQKSRGGFWNFTR